MTRFSMRPCERCGHPAEVNPKADEHLCPRCVEMDGLSILERTNLDATKWMAHAVREHGRFGSHPSHDRFDGDSEP